MFIKWLWHLTSNIFSLLNTFIACSDMSYYLDICVVLVNILKHGKISSFRASIYSALFVILQSYTQNISWKMFSYPLTILIGVKIIFNNKVAFLWWVRIKPKLLNNIFLFRWFCFLLWNDPGEILTTITILLS